jgi:aromatic-L-amino-acid decarboxylase
VTVSPAHSLSLDVERDVVLAHATSIVAGAWRSFDRYRPGQPEVGEELRELFRRALPDQASPALAALDAAAAALDASLAQPRPRFFAFIGSSALEIGVLADALAACFDVNLASWAGAASEIEDQAVRWVGEFVGFAGEAGAFTSGGTISNLTALTAARERALPGSRRSGLGGRRLALYCSAESHYSVVRAAELLGVGTDGVRALPIDASRRLRPDAVAEAIDADRAAGSCPWRSWPRPGRRSPARSIRSPSSPGSAPSAACGSTSTGPTACRRPGPPTRRRSSPASSAPTR